MKEQLKAYVNAMFRGAALTVQNAELREEILQNTLDRYDDLLAEGRSEKAAYEEAIAGIGDVSQLIEQDAGSEATFPQPPAAPRVAVAAGPEAREDEDDELPEGPAKKLTGSLHAILWMVGIAAYFLVSFTTGTWYITWVIFLALSAGSCFLDAWAVARIKGFYASKGGVVGGMWMLMLTAYFLVSFATGAWYITWLMFLIATALSFVIDAYYDFERSKSAYE